MSDRVSGRLIQIKQGYSNGDTIPEFENGEFGLVLDEGQEELYIGSNSGNIQVITERNIAQLAVQDASISRQKLDGEVNTLLDSIGSATSIPEATTSQKGLMSSNDKTKLNSIETGATNTVIVNNLTSLSTTSALSAYQGKLLKDMVDAVGSGGSTVAVVDNLTSTDTSSALSANQGRVLKGLVDNKADKTTATTTTNGLMSSADKQKLDNMNTTPVTVVNSLTSTSTTSALSANQGRVLNETKLSGYQNGVTRSSTSTAIGYQTKASGEHSYAVGFFTEATGYNSYAQGYMTKATGSYSHAEGSVTEASGSESHAEGINTTASGYASHAEGNDTQARGENSHAEGNGTVATGYNSHTEGYYTIAIGYASHAQGHYNRVGEGTNNSFNISHDAFMIGNGLSESTRSNAFRVKFNGQVYGRSAYNSSGADYAEYFEWLDGNFNNEDRVGYFVTLDGDKIRKANSKDDYILGIISATPSVVGDSASEGWNEQYVRDEFGRIQYHYVDMEREELDENGEKVTVIKNEYHPIYNPDYDTSKKYIPREDRKEWDAVGMMGKLLVRDDGTCEVNGYCKSNDDGIAIKSDEGYRVMKRVSDNIIQVLVK